MNYLSILAIVAIMLMTTCEDEISEPEVLSASGTVIFTGSPAVDGCDWLINISEDTDYRPVEMAEEFYKENLEITFTYQLTGDDFVCGWGRKVPKIAIIGIEKK